MGRRREKPASRSSTSGPTDGFGLRAAIAVMTDGRTVPYVFATATFGALLLLLRRHGEPGVGDVLTFVAGALVALALLTALAVDVAPGAGRRARGASLAVEGIALAAALGAASLIAGIDSWGAWPLAGFTSTVLCGTTGLLERANAAARDRLFDR